MPKPKFLTKPTERGWYWLIRVAIRQIHPIKIGKVLKTRFWFGDGHLSGDRLDRRLHADADDPVWGYRLVGPIAPPDISELEKT